MKGRSVKDWFVRKSRSFSGPNWCNNILCGLIKWNGRCVLLTVICVLLLYTFWFSGIFNVDDDDEQIHSNPCTLSTIGNFSTRSQRCITELPGKVLTAECPSRLGNQMFSYAILYAISLYNIRPAYMSPVMSNYISKYFQVSMSTLDEHLYKSTTWKVQYLGANIPDNIRNLTPEDNIKFCCYPQTWKYFDEMRPRIRKEFRFHDKVSRAAQKQLEISYEQFFSNQNQKEPATFVGVHIRRTDYLTEQTRIHFLLPTFLYYKGAMEYFKSKYTNTIFVFASDDINWCRENFATMANRHNFHIYYINGTSQEDGGRDLAVLTKCDHVIFGMGTFGFWAGYLNPGEVVYCADCITKESVWFKDPLVYGGDYGNFVLPFWKGFFRNGSSIS